MLVKQTNAGNGFSTLSSLIPSGGIYENKNNMVRGMI
jgi:hypothetical protein